MFDECLSAHFPWTELRERRHCGDHTFDARSARPEGHRPAPVRSARGGDAALIFDRPYRRVCTDLPVERVCMQSTDPHGQKLAQPSRTARSLPGGLSAPEHRREGGRGLRMRCLGASSTPHNVEPLQRRSDRLRGSEREPRVASSLLPGAVETAVGEQGTVRCAGACGIPRAGAILLSNRFDD